MKRLALFISIIVVLSSCSNMWQDKDSLTALTTASNLLPTSIDSATLLLSEIESPLELSNSNRALYAILYLEALDKSYKPITEYDSLINFAVSYYKGGLELQNYAKAKFYLARVYEDKGELELSVANYIDTKNIAAQIPDYNLMGLAHASIALLYEDDDKYDLVLKNAAIAEEYYKEANNTDGQLSVIYRKARAHAYLKNMDSTVLEYQRGAEIAINCSNKKWLSRLLNLVGYEYSKRGLFDEVEKILLTAEQEGVSEDNSIIELRSVMYINQKRYDLATQYFLDLIDKNNADSTYNAEKLGVLLGAYVMLANIEDLKRNYQKALEYYKESVAIGEEIENINETKRTIEIETKYNSQKLKTANAQLKLRSSSLWIIAMLLVLVLAGATFIYYSILSERNKRILLSKLDISALKIKEDQLKSILTRKMDLSKNIAIWLQTPEDKFSVSQFKKVFADAALTQQEWTTFLNEIDQVYYGFATYIKQKYNLSDENVRLSSMLCAGFDTGEIATLLGVEFYTVYTKRSRLRKKININEKEDLSDYFARIINELREKRA